MIVGLSGKFSSGKDTVADHLVQKYGFRKVGFADKLKSVCRDLFGMTGKDRSLLQIVGERMREIDPEVWIRYPFRRLAPNQNVVVTDVRYQNEFDWLKAHDARMVRLECPERERLDRYERLYGGMPSAEQLRHLSETDLDAEDRFDAYLFTTAPFTDVAAVLDTHIRRWAEEDRRVYQSASQQMEIFHENAA